VATCFASRVTVILSVAPNPVPFTVTGVVCGPNVGESVIAAVPDACAAILTETSKPNPMARIIKSDSALILLVRTKMVIKNLTFAYADSIEHKGLHFV
jgi:hypothetical protein